MIQSSWNVHTSDHLTHCKHFVRKSSFLSFCCRHPAYSINGILGIPQATSDANDNLLKRKREEDEDTRVEEVFAHLVFVELLHFSDPRAVWRRSTRGLGPSTPPPTCSRWAMALWVNRGMGPIIQGFISGLFSTVCIDRLCQWESMMATLSPGLKHQCTMEKSQQI